jgi:DNA-binding LytR/AlgR family response regulator
MKAIIIEDEDIIAKVLLNKIKSVSPDIEIITILPSLKKARKWFSENAEPDFMFMDIQLSDGVSFDIFKDFDLKCPIIFTTAYDEYAVKAFRLNGADYLLKPVDDDDLKTAISRCKNIISKQSSPVANINELIQQLSHPSSAPAYKEKFIVNFRNQWLPIKTDQIACFCKEAINYIYLESGERYSLDFVTLDEIEELIDPQKFYRANRQFIVNIEAIESVKPIENAKLIIKLKSPNQKLEIDISRVKTPEFKKWLDR